MSGWRIRVGGTNIAREFRGGGQILSACDFQICTAPPPAINKDRSLQLFSQDEAEYDVRM